MKVLILVGGLGTSLRGVVNDKPKAMVKVDGKPFLEYLILQLKQFGFEDIILSTGYLSQEIEDYFGTGNRWEVNISYSREKEPLGTGGAVKLAEDLMDEDDFLVMNEDSFLDIDLSDLIHFHRKKAALASMALVKVENPKRYGLVEIDKDKWIINFIEKEKASQSNLINGGVYVFNKAIFDEIPDNEKVSLEKQIFPTLVGKEFYGMPTDAYFIDIGTPEDYMRLKQNPQVLVELIRGQ